MNIETVSWGSLEVDEEQIYRFEKGIPGFEEEKAFVRIDLEGSPFFYLQSVSEPALSFLLTDPFTFYPNYEFEIPDQEVQELGDEGLISVSCIVTIQGDLETSTINLLAPVIANTATHQGKQIVLHNGSYQTRHPLLAQSRAGEEGGE